VQGAHNLGANWAKGRGVNLEDREAQRDEENRLVSGPAAERPFFGVEHAGGWFEVR
jgi:hypothetical protein